MENDKYHIETVSGKKSITNQPLLTFRCPESSIQLYFKTSVLEAVGQLSWLEHGVDNTKIAGSI